MTLRRTRVGGADSPKETLWGDVQRFFHFYPVAEQGRNHQDDHLVWAKHFDQDGYVACLVRFWAL